jgi:hypothetical protein
MNAYNKAAIEDDESGVLESCDCCNKLIYNWDCLQLSFVTFDNQIVCNDCRSELAKVNPD